MPVIILKEIHLKCLFPIVKESFPLSELLLGRKLVDTHETSLVGKRDTTQGTQNVILTLLLSCDLEMVYSFFD